MSSSRRDVVCARFNDTPPSGAVAKTPTWRRRGLALEREAEARPDAKLVMAAVAIVPSTRNLYSSFGILNCFVLICEREKFEWEVQRAEEREIGDCGDGERGRKRDRIRGAHGSLLAT
jgi:hypothetical protein